MAIAFVVGLLVVLPILVVSVVLAANYSLNPSDEPGHTAPSGGTVSKLVAAVVPETELNWTINSSRMTSSSGGARLARGRAVVHSASANSEEGRIAAALGKWLTENGTIPAVEVTSDERPMRGGAPLPDVVIRIEPRPAAAADDAGWVVTASDRWDRSNHSYSGYLTPPVVQWVWRGEVSSRPALPSRLPQKQREKLVKKLGEQIRKAMEIDLPILPPREPIADLFPPFEAPPEFPWLATLKARPRMAGAYLMTPTLAYWEFTTDEPPSAWYPAIRDSLKGNGGWNVSEEAGADRVVLSVRARDDGTHLEIFKRTEAMGEPVPPREGTRTYVVCYERTWSADDVDAALKAALGDPERAASVHMLSRYWYRDKDAVRAWLADHPPRTADAWLIVGDWHQQDGATEAARAAWLNAHTLDRLVGSNKLESSIKERVKKAGQEPLPLFPDEAGFAALGVETLDGGTSGRTFDIDASRPVVFRRDVATADEGSWRFLGFTVTPLSGGQVTLKRMETDWRNGGYSAGTSTSAVRPSDRDQVSFGQSDGKSYRFYLLEGGAADRYVLRVDSANPSP